MMRHIEYPNLEPLFGQNQLLLSGPPRTREELPACPLKFALDHGYKGQAFPGEPEPGRRYWE